MIFSLLSGNLTLQSVIAQILAVLVIIFLVLPFHEWAHAFVAYKLGDKSIKYRGRLTLNPIEHIDPMGALFLLLFGYGWAKPVEVDSSAFKNPKAGMAITAAAGPVSNILAAMVGGLILNALYAFAPGFLFASTVGAYIYIFLSYFISVNITLAVFNILPIPPLDGSKVLFAFLPDKAVMFFYRNQRYISIILMVLVFVGILDVPISFLSNIIYKFVMSVTGLPFTPFIGG